MPASLKVPSWLPIVGLGEVVDCWFWSGLSDFSEEDRATNEEAQAQNLSTRGKVLWLLVTPAKSAGPEGIQSDFPTLSQARDHLS